MKELQLPITPGNYDQWPKHKFWDEDEKDYVIGVWVLSYEKSANPYCAGWYEDGGWRQSIFRHCEPIKEPTKRRMTAQELMGKYLVQPMGYIRQVIGFNSEKEKILIGGTGWGPASSVVEYRDTPNGPNLEPYILEGE